MDLIKSQPRTSFEEEDCCQFALQLSSASVLPMVLRAVIDLGVLEIIGKAGLGAHLSALEIASNLPTKNPEAPVMLERMLRLLASYSVLTFSLLTNDNGEVQRLYGLGPVCKYFIRDNEGASMAPFLHMLQDKPFMESWYHLKDVVLEGGTAFNKAHGMDLVEYFAKDSSYAKVFKDTSTDFNIVIMRKILDTYKGFEGLKVLVDVGGGTGIVLNMIISRYPSIKGVNFDLPKVIEKMPSYPGVENVAGDMFESVPNGDAIFMKWILHGWSDESCIKLLRNCYKALPDNGKVISMDLVIPPITESIPANKDIFQFDSFIMTTNPVNERTEKEYEAIGKEAGFAGVRIVGCSCNYSLMEFYKNM